MRKTARFKRFKLWHGLSVGLIMFGLGVGITISQQASQAQSTGTVIPLPASSVQSNGTVRQIESGVDVSGGVNVGSNVPGSAPGTPSQPLPTFSGVNSGVIVSTDGPIKVADDAVLYGLTDTKNGFIHNRETAGVPTMSVSLSASSPASTTLAKGTTSYTVTQINLTPKQDLAINSITVMRGGTSSGSSTDIGNIKLYDGSNLLGTATTMPLTTNMVTFSGLNLVISAGATKALSLRVDVLSSADGGDKFQLGIASYAHIRDANGSAAVGTFPVMGNLFTVAGTSPYSAFPIQPVPATDPVTIYDDLYINGSSPQETGNLFIKGSIVSSTGLLKLNGNVQAANNVVAQGMLATNIGLVSLGQQNILLGTTSLATVNIAGNATVSGTLNVSTGATIANGLVVNSGTVRVSDLAVVNTATIGNGLVSVTGDIIATRIGGYYLVENSRSSTTAGSKTVTVACGTGDIITSCNAHFAPAFSTTEIALQGSRITKDKSGTVLCGAVGYQNTTGTRYLTAQAICFNPDRSTPSGYTGTKIDLN